MDWSFHVDDPDAVLKSPPAETSCSAQTSNRIIAQRHECSPLSIGVVRCLVPLFVPGLLGQPTEGSVLAGEVRGGSE